MNGSLKRGALMTYEIAIPAESSNRAEVVATSQPEEVGVNEIFFWLARLEF